MGVWRWIALTICGVFFCLTPGPAQAGDGIKTAGEILRIALPAAAGGFSLYRQDYDGVLQLGVSEIFAEGASLVLQHIIHEQRPDKSDFRSFPSDSAAVAFSAASFLQIVMAGITGCPLMRWRASWVIRV